MKPILDSMTAREHSGNASLGTSSATLGSFRPGSSCRATFGTPLQSLPPLDREWSSARAERVAASAPGLDGESDPRISRLDGANREWFTWRFGEDA